MGRKEDLGAEIANRIDRWNHLCEFGGKDPTYADGVNMNIVRNHILIAKQKCEKELDGDYPQEYYFPTPDVVDPDYMARSAEIEENAKKEGVVTLPSGLQYKVLREGNGAIPKLDDNVVVKYEGTLIDGTKFDSSYDRNPQTTTFKPTQVIKGWTEALTMMPVGSKWMLFIPENLAYGERQAGKIPAYSTLIFTVELEEIK